MSVELDSRLLRLKAELDDHARIARYPGLGFERPIRLTPWRHLKIESARGVAAGRGGQLTGAQPAMPEHPAMPAVPGFQF